MKRLLTILLSFIGVCAMAQTYDTLPTGSRPYGNFYLGPDGNLVFGNAGLKFRVLGTKKRIDSLLALKQDISAMDAYVTKTGTETLTNKTLTAPQINNPDMNSGTANSLTMVNGSINNAPIGSAIASTIRGTTITATVDVLLPSATPSNGLSAAPVAYVQNAINGLSWKQQVDFATTGNITLSGTQTVDGVSSGNAKRALVKNQTNPAQNGVYITSSSGAWTRTADANTADNLSKLTVLVGGGLSQQYTVWTSAGAVITVGTDPVNMVQSAGPGSYLSGSNMRLDGNVFSTVNAPVFDTQPASDNSNKAATTYHVGSRLATGQIIGASTTGTANNASLWNGYSISSLPPTSGNFIVYNGTNFITKDIIATSPLSWNASTSGMSINIAAAKVALNLNDGSNLNNIAANSVLWQGQAFGGGNNSNLSTLMGYDATTSQWRNTPQSQITSGNSDKWGGVAIDLSGTRTTAPYSVYGYDNLSGTSGVYNNTGLKSFLATSLQDVTSVGAIANTGITINSDIGLTVNGGTGGSGQVKYTNATSGTVPDWRTGIVGNKDFSIYDNSASGAGAALNVSMGSGNVGIGTTTPITKFQTKVGTDQNFGILSSSGETAISAFNDAVTANVPLRFNASVYRFNVGRADFMGSSNEVARFIGAQPFFTFYDATNTNRIGYLQHTGTDLTMSNDVGNIILANNTKAIGHLQANSLNISYADGNYYQGMRPNTDGLGTEYYNVVTAGGGVPMHVFKGYDGTNLVELFSIINGGGVKVNNLAGTGSRPVFANASGGLEAGSLSGYATTGSNSFTGNQNINEGYIKIYDDLGTNTITLDKSGMGSFVTLSANTAPTHNNDVLRLTDVNSGTYTPTVTVSTNASSATSALAHYTKVGNQVTVTGKVSSASTSVGLNVDIYVTLPPSLPSNLTASDDLIGHGSLNLSSNPTMVILNADTTGDRALLTIGATGTTAGFTAYYTFTYTIK